VLGLLLSQIGTDVYTNTPRFTLGHLELADGIDFTALAVGVFGIAEILRNLENEQARSVAVSQVTRLLPRRADLKAIAAPIARGTALGSLLGILPGGGTILASFSAYAVERKLSPTPERFGHGAIEGVAGPESANNAAAQTSFIPMLTLGIPANPVMALMIGAMIIQGIIPGPDVAQKHAPLFWGVIASMWIGNLMLIVLNLPLIGLWVRLLTLPYYVLFPAILAFSAIGVFTVNQSAFDLYTVALFGALGYALLRLGCEPAPLLFGFVLGRMLEEHFRRAMIVSQGDWSIFVTRPISATFLALAALALVVIVLPKVRGRRDAVFEEQ
jgi:putative tricarboxylic transport membrane protein